MAYRLLSQGASKRLEPYAGKLARTVLRGEWRSNAPLLPDRPATANGNGAPASDGEAMPADATGSAEPEGASSIPF